MFTLLSDFERVFDRPATFNQLLSYFDRWAGRGLEGNGSQVDARWPRTTLHDEGANLVLTAELPGLSEKDIKVSLNQNVLTLAAERKVTVPQGFAPQRQERSDFKFSRSYQLPVRVDAERTEATLKNGVLTLSLAKAADAQPRQITVKAQ